MAARRADIAPSRSAEPASPPGWPWLRVALWCATGAAVVAAGARLSGGLNPSSAPTPREIIEAHRAARDSIAPVDGPATPATPLFTDVAPSLGIDFVHDNGAAGEHLLPEIVGPGAAFLDYDNDGDLDVFVTGGGAIVPGEGQAQSCRLYRSDGDIFTDVTIASGANVPGPAYAAACADYDNDGDVDIYVTRLGPNALLQNRGDGTFEEIGERARVADVGFGASAAFFDLDRDGLLDLYMTNYVAWTLAGERRCYSPGSERDYCHPNLYDAASIDRLYRNRGDGSFEDVTEAAGISASRGNGLGVVAADFDDDGWPDLYVANDNTPAFLWRNQGDGTFRDVALASGAAYDGRGVAIAGMGIAAEDIDGDSDVDLLVTNITGQHHLLLDNSRGDFLDNSTALGVHRWSLPATGFGVVVFDQDNDGELDAYIANGAVNIGSASSRSSNPYAESDHFVRLVDGRFIDATAGSGAAGDVGRGLATGDYDGDGDLDLLLLNNGGPLRLLRNNNASRGAWLIVDARVGNPSRAAIGARITARAGNRSWVREVRAQSSYLSSSDPRVHFGLGTIRQLDELTITWPDGSRETRTDQPVNRVLTFEQSGDRD